MSKISDKVPNVTARKVRTEKELAQAIKQNADTIEISGDLKNKVIVIKATGQVAWVVAIGGIGVAIAAIIAMPTPAAPAAIGVEALGLTGVAATFHGIIATPAVASTVVGVTGKTVALSAVSIGVAGGGVGVLNKLRSYKLEKKNNVVILRKK
ncbi:MAG: hypothetical protein IJ644_01785 [Oscillospiraceae bacterium]|nr:hypothetical protein [Oscillospiraceae bacterium]